VVGWFLGGQKKYQYQGWPGFFWKTLVVVFLNSHRQEAPVNAIKQKKSWRKTDIEISVEFLRIFAENVFDMGFLPFFFNVFLNSPHRETPKKRT
jgi:hypothetical protein